MKKTVTVTIVNEASGGGWLNERDWAKVHDSLVNLAHSYAVEIISPIGHKNYLQGWIGRVDESDIPALELALAVTANAFDLTGAFVGATPLVGTTAIRPNPNQKQKEENDSSN